MAEALGVASSVIAVVDLSAKVFSLCLQYSGEVKNAKDDIERLRKEVTAFQDTTEKLKALLEGPRGRELETSQQLISAIEDGHSTLGKLEHQLRPSTGRKAMSRFGMRALKWPFESKNVEGTIQNLERCRGSIYLALSIDQTVILQNVDHKIALDTLPVAEGASFDSHAEEHNPTCLANTREELLRDIDRWIDDPNSETIFWLNGMAGTGKSTISRTVARSRSKQSDLGASFFFKRGETDRGSLAKFVPTVARRLAWSMPEVAPFIKSALDADSAIVGKAVREQFEKLVREPLSKATGVSLSRPSIVIVVDALDECEKDADIKLLLELFSGLSFPGSLRVRVFVTSRPELPVRLGFSSIGNTHRDLILHKIPPSIIEHDISVFLRHEFANIRNCFNAEAVEELKLPVHWPGEANLEKLTRAAVPLFIFAATLCRFVNDSCLGNPDELLQSVLHHTGSGHASKLDMTYSPVLKQQVINRSGRERCDIIESFRLVVGTIIMLASPLSIRALALLLDIPVNKVTTRLRVLHSVLEVPESLDSPVRLLHLSFRDYLVDSENRETVEFWVNEKLAHRNLAKHCLRVMHGALRENICSLSFPGMRRSAVGVGLLEERIPSELQYACMYWVHHQTKADFEPSDSNDIHDFLKTHFLHWLEALSLLSRVKECLDTLRSMTRWLENQESSSLSFFVADAVRFLQTNFSVIAEAPLQIYSCLIFAPSNSIVRKTFDYVIPKWISTLPKVQEGWDACLLTLEGHSGSVWSVVFSHDSTKLASASSDKTVRIWNAETGECERVLEGHGDWARSVVFSHDSTKLASVSYDKAIRIWNAETGDCERLLEGHGDEVSSVVFSHDSTKLASASHDLTVRIWNAETGDCERVLEGHSDGINSVTFSHDSTKVASASYDKTIRIWNAETGDCERLLEGHGDWVSSVVFSHDSKRVASASRDKAVRIWNAETGECERVLEGHSDWVSSVVFSHDSTKLASASHDRAVRIWNAETGECERVLEGHNDWVLSVVFSHDSTKLASASHDKTIRIWNAEAGECEDVISLDAYATVLSSTPDERDIVTNRGVFTLIGGSRSWSKPPVSLQFSETPMLACKDGTWVTTAGKDLLWLPPECRNGEVATAESTIVIGCPSGRVVLPSTTPLSA
ncbi:hypothetical protein FNYG_08603 [Fusarium nygamai]|uniref:NACHT domain-containing protein n=1 Tax=Gibberella nygamai TaxID=42673 RepID=A0A2K0W710_GIBNY|nr:hypothetical protein FNYG_08603 [Fusarium nygamai]